jgi:hypothetical protein
MAAPNIVGVTTITGKTYFTSLSDTSTTTLLNNAANSGKVFKVNSIIVANDDGSSAADVTISLYPQDDQGGTAVQLASTISVAADSTLVVLDRASSIYLEEDRTLTAAASAGNDLNVIVSYEEISS